MLRAYSIINGLKKCRSLLHEFIYKAYQGQEACHNVSTTVPALYGDTPGLFVGTDFRYR